jgi:hypothetical protein
MILRYWKKSFVNDSENNIILVALDFVLWKNQMGKMLLSTNSCEYIFLHWCIFNLLLACALSGFIRTYFNTSKSLHASFISGKWDHINFPWLAQFQCIKFNIWNMWKFHIWNLNVEFHIWNISYMKFLCGIVTISYMKISYMKYFIYEIFMWNWNNFIYEIFHITFHIWNFHIWNLFQFHITISYMKFS